MYETKAIVVGVDSKAFWQLEFFFNFLYKFETEMHSAGITPVIYDLGMTKEQRAKAETFCFGGLDEAVIDLKDRVEGWFAKPAVMSDAAWRFDKTVWVDVDVEITNPRWFDIFDRIEYNKLLMAEDRPWTKRRGEKWHNSGVVGFSFPHPNILKSWQKAMTMNHGQRGDQEVLHQMLKNPLDRVKHITDLPSRYNFLRIDEIDGHDPEKAWAIHWTGDKGKVTMKERFDADVKASSTHIGEW